MKTLFTLGLVCCLFPLLAQDAARVKHLDGQSISTEVLKERLTYLVDSAKLAGLQVAIINENKLVWSGSFGFKDIENKKGLNDSTVMYAASLTKPVTAYIFMRLVDRGVFSLDKPIHNYLKSAIGTYPKWRDLAEDTVLFNQITPRMLLSHSAGLPVLRQIYGNSTKLIAKPGARFYYSNEGINLLGLLIEEFLGKPLEVIAREEVFEPLLMPRTSMIWEKPFEDNFSYAYFKDGKKYGSERRRTSRAAGSMSTTAADYARFYIALMTKKGLAKQSFRQMLEAQIPVTSKRGFGSFKDSLTHENDAIKLSWGLGLGLFQSPYGKAFFHTGHGDANQNYAVAFPERGIAVVLLSNSENFEKTSTQIIEACIGDRYSPLKWLGHLDQ